MLSSLLVLVRKIFLIPEGVSEDLDVVLILCVSAVTLWVGVKLWGLVSGGGKDKKTPQPGPLPPIPDYSYAPPPNQVTPLENWRLRVSHGSHGRHEWVFLDSEEERRAWPQTNEDKYWLGLKTDSPKLKKATTPLEAARNGYEFYKTIQSKDGHWAGEYGGPMFTMPGLVIAIYVTKARPLTEPQRVEIIRYLCNRADVEEGGWGIHTHSKPTVFGTSLNYVALRILGLGPDHPVCAKARKNLHKMGGAGVVPSWGKAWLAILNCYKWEGLSPICPELILFPEWLPFHPWRWWIHVRNVYFPMAYLYSKKFQTPVTPLILELRSELYLQPYDSVPFHTLSNVISPIDLYYPHHPFFTILSYPLGALEWLVPRVFPALRRLAERRLFEMVKMEDENTNCQTVGPVSKALGMVSRFVEEGEGSPAVETHRETAEDFLWMGREGLMVTGTNGSQAWDAAFIAQALVETGLAKDPSNKESLVHLLDWLDKCQIRENPRHYEKAWRHCTKGAWPFSTPQQSYLVSDTTSEALKAVMALQDLDFVPELVGPRRLMDAVDSLLTMQNASGGFASYELIRGPAWLEWLNHAEVFGNIMTEYDYPECTTSVLSALEVFSKKFPDYRRQEIETTIKNAVKYIHSSQREDGSWFGSWGICFTYAMNFSLESLHLAGETYANSSSVRRACAFLLSKRMDDGGWGETYMSCVTGVYTPHSVSQVCQTAWALLSLISAGYPEREPIESAVKVIMDRQLEDGSWAQEDIEGIFNKNCAIVYPNFKFSFTIWALGKADLYLQELDAQDKKKLTGKWDQPAHA